MYITIYCISAQTETDSPNFWGSLEPRLRTTAPKRKILHQNKNRYNWSNVHKYKIFSLNIFLTTTCLEENNIPKALQILQSCFLFSTLKFTVVNEALKLGEALFHQQLSLTCIKHINYYNYNLWNKTTIYCNNERDEINLYLYINIQTIDVNTTFHSWAAK